MECRLQTCPEQERLAPAEKGLSTKQAARHQLSFSSEDAEAREARPEQSSTYSGAFESYNRRN